MNIQIFGKAKCFDTKKAQRYFKERGIRFQNVDLKVKGMSKGEIKSVAAALGGIDALVDEKTGDAAVVRYLAYDEDKAEKLADHPEYLKTPIVRNGRQATVGYRPEVWKTWE
ncbi:MAG: arsenate reductase family protein [Candidatus Howiella sp.]